MMKRFGLSTMVGMLCACAADLGSGSDDDAGAEVLVDDVGGPHVGHVEQGDGMFVTTVDATSETEWVYLRLADGAEVEVADPAADTSWDLAFLRFHVKLDGGVSHILLDEAQDTSPDQWRILKALTDDIFAGAGAERDSPRTLVVVGDEKQSIYSFQGADP